MSRPSPFLKLIFDAPAWLYRKRLGWLLGKRFLVVTHRGRKTGLPRQTVLEVVFFDPARRESVVASAYGPKADWYRNLEAEPALRIRTGRLEYVPEQRFLNAGEARRAAARFCREHPLEARAAPRVLAAIGAVEKGSFSDPVDLLAALPMVAFRPAD